MEIINKENFITNNQIAQFIKLMGEEYFPKKIIVFETRLQNAEYNIKNVLNVQEFDIEATDSEALYNPIGDVLKVFTYNTELEDSIESKQYDILYEIARELRKRYYYESTIIQNGVDFLNVMELEYVTSTIELLENQEYENLIEQWVNDFINKNSSKIAGIMNWEDEFEALE